MSFSKTVSEWKGYGIIIDNGLLFFLVLFPNLGDIKRMVKRNNFFSSEVFTLWEKWRMCVLHKLSETLRSRQAQLWQNSLFKWQFACQKKSVFFMQLLEPASFAVIHLTDAPVLFKEQICISASSMQGQRKQWSSKNWKPSRHWQMHWRPRKEMDLKLRGRLSWREGADWWKHKKRPGS